MPSELDLVPEVDDGIIVGDEGGTFGDFLKRLEWEDVVDRICSNEGPDTVVRVKFPGFVRRYAYACAGGPGVGSLVRVVSPYTGSTVVPVVALGRGDYQGTLKRAELIR